MGRVSTESKPFEGRDLIYLVLPCISGITTLPGTQFVLSKYFFNGK